MAFVMTQLGADLGRFDAALRAAQARLTAFASGPLGTPAGVGPPGGAERLVEGLAAWLKVPQPDADVPPKSGKSRDESAVERGVRPAPDAAVLDRGALLALGAALRAELARLGTRVAGHERATVVPPDFRQRGAELRHLVAAVPAGGPHVRAAEHTAPPPLGRPVNVLEALGTRPAVSRHDEAGARPRVLVQHDRTRWDRAARFLSELHTRESSPTRQPDTPGPPRIDPVAATEPPPARPRPIFGTAQPERADRTTGQADMAVREDLTRFLDGLLQRLDPRAPNVAPPRAQPPGPFPANTARLAPFGDPAAFAGLLRDALAGNGRLVAAAEATARNTQELATLARKPPPPAPSVLVGPE